MMHASISDVQQQNICVPHSYISVVLRLANKYFNLKVARNRFYAMQTIDKNCRIQIYARLKRRQLSINYMYCVRQVAIAQFRLFPIAQIRDFHPRPFSLEICCSFKVYTILDILPWLVQI